MPGALRGPFAAANLLGLVLPMADKSAADADHHATVERSYVMLDSPDERVRETVSVYTTVPVVGVDVGWSHTGVKVAAAHRRAAAVVSGGVSAVIGGTRPARGAGRATTAAHMGCFRECLDECKQIVPSGTRIRAASN